MSIELQSPLVLVILLPVYLLRNNSICFSGVNHQRLIQLAVQTLHAAAFT